MEERPELEWRFRESLYNLLEQLDEKAHLAREQASKQMFTPNMHDLQGRANGNRTARNMLLNVILNHTPKKEPHELEKIKEIERNFKDIR